MGQSQFGVDSTLKLIKFGSEIRYFITINISKNRCYLFGRIGWCDITTSTKM